MNFTKMHGIGNDYVFVDVFEQEIVNPAEIARRVSPRNFSVGSDGLILIGPSQKADASMRIFNADGSEAEMCGNGVRCVAKYVWDHDITKKNPLTIETQAGVKTLQLTLDDETDLVETVRVDMGKPGLKSSEIPVITGDGDEEVVDYSVVISGHHIKITCVSMGNPHCIVPVDTFEQFDWRKLGSAIENNSIFPRRTNVHFVKPISRTEIDVKTWERGSGATLACGTGASAVCVAANLLGIAEPDVKVNLPGGSLDIEWDKNTDKVYMTGPAVEVYKGVWTGYTLL